MPYPPLVYYIPKKEVHRTIREAAIGKNIFMLISSFQLSINVSSQVLAHKISPGQ